MAGVGWGSAHEGLLVDASRTPPVGNGARSMGEALRRDQRHSGIGVRGDAMRWVQQLFFKVRAIVRRSHVEREMEAELAAHLEAEARMLMSKGMDPVEARRVAANTMGHVELIREECRDS